MSARGVPHPKPVSLRTGKVFGSMRGSIPSPEAFGMARPHRPIPCPTKNGLTSTDISSSTLAGGVAELRVMSFRLALRSARASAVSDASSPGPARSPSCSRLSNTVWVFDTPGTVTNTSRSSLAVVVAGSTCRISALLLSPIWMRFASPPDGQTGVIEKSWPHYSWSPA